MPPRRTSSSVPNLWPWLTLFLVLAGFGIAGAWLYVDERGGDDVTTVTIATVQETTTAPAPVP
jgi:hypothetical protein